MDKLEKGRLGEDAVCTLLEQRGHEIIARNYHRRCGEIDIISKCGGFVVFTEVKARKHDSLISGLEAVDFRKQAKIIRTADLWLSDNDTGTASLNFLLSGKSLTSAKSISSEIVLYFLNRFCCDRYDRRKCF